MKNIVPLLVACGLAAVPAARAALTVQHYWNLDQTGVPYTDSVGGNSLDTTLGTVTSSPSVFAPGSSGSVLFSNAGVYTAAATITSYSDNFAFEIWADPTSSTGTQILANLGSGSALGLQISISNGFWAFGGNGSGTVVSTVAVGTGLWTNLAYVVDGGVAKVFINGSAISGTYPVPALTGSSVLALGFGSGGVSRYTGYLDNARLSTFTAGQFQTSDLMVNSVPEPASYGLAGAGAMAAIVAMRRRKSVR